MQSECDERKSAIAEATFTLYQFIWGFWFPKFSNSVPFNGVILLLILSR